MVTTASAPHDKAAIDEITAAFFDAFTNCGGRVPDVDRLYDLFIPQAIIIKNTSEGPQVFDVAGFVEPRRAMLCDGSLTEFRETEVSERTDVYRGIAQRSCTYEKSWNSAGSRHEGRGGKTIQFVRTAAGWRIASLVWDDEV